MRNNVQVHLNNVNVNVYMYKMYCNCGIKARTTCIGFCIAIVVMYCCCHVVQLSCSLVVVILSLGLLAQCLGNIAAAFVLVYW